MTNEIHNISNNAYIINTVIIAAWFYWAKLGSPIRIFLPQCFLYKLHYAPQMVSVWVLATVNKQYVKMGPGQCICKDNMIHDTSVFSFFFFFFFLLFVCFCCCFFTLEKEMELIETQPGFEPGSSEFGQMLLLSEPLELWY